MNIQSLYQRWYDDISSDPFYSDKPQLLSFDAFISTWLTDVDLLIDNGINPHTLTSDIIDNDDEFDTGVFNSKEYVFILQSALAS